MLKSLLQQKTHSNASIMDKLSINPIFIYMYCVVFAKNNTD